jgi:hypothetical protein
LALWQQAMPQHEPWETQINADRLEPHHRTPWERIGLRLIDDAHRGMADIEA